MGLCLQCNKWIKQPEGKRTKLFCNNTCRSNYWYGKNKKGDNKSVSQQAANGNVPTKPPAAHIDIERPKQVFIPQKLSRAEIEAIKHRYVEERRECGNAEDYFDWVKRLENDTRISKTDRDLIKNTN